MNFKAFLLLIIVSIFSLYSCNNVAFSPDPKSDPVSVYEYFIQDFKNNYALFELKGITSDTFGNHLRQSVSLKSTDSELFKIISQQARTVHDGHVTVKSPFAISGYDFWQSVPENGPVNITNYINVGSLGVIQYRTMKEPTIGYIFIPSFEGTKSDFETIDNALDKLSDKKGLIIDVRSNGGGQTQNAEIVASRFAEKRVVYGKTSAKIGTNKNDFSAWEEIIVEPLGKSQWLKPVIILTNRRCFSSAELFLMIMQNFSNVRIVGDTTGGGIGSPVGRELPNGWVYRLSTHRFVRPDDSTPEGKGIIPNFKVWTTNKDITDGRDRILEKAIELLK